MTAKYTWDGDKVLLTQKIEPVKHTPKDILNGLDHVRNQINQLQQGDVQLQQQIKTNQNSLKSAKDFEKEMTILEDRCIELQKEKILWIISRIHVQSMKKAKEDADIAVSKDPNAYDERQVKQLPYLNYQKLLATDKGMAEKISSRMIRTYLYDTPIFNNPFEE